MDKCIHNFKYNRKDGNGINPYLCSKCGKRTRHDYYTYPKDALPELNYSDPKIKKKRCGNCNHMEVTNPNASIPGHSCKIMEALFKKKGYENGNSHAIDMLYGGCKFYNYPSIKKALNDIPPTSDEKE